MSDVVPMRPCDVREATHVKVGNRDRFDRIAYKWGIETDGTLAAPSQGGFGVVTEHSERVTMWDAHSYYQAAPERL